MTAHVPNAKRIEVIGSCALYLGDCLEIMPHLGKVDAVVTDPPYGIQQDKGFSGSGVAPRRTYDGDWDLNRPQPLVFSQMISCAPVQIIWGGQYFSDLLPVNGKWLWWDKCQTMPTYGDGELAWTNLSGAAPKKFVYSNNGMSAREKERFHPTQKPIAVMEWCIGHLPIERGTILDPFMGSGTTGVACVKKGFSFIGIEQHEPYFDIACERIRKAYAQPDFFVQSPAPKPVQEELL